MDKRLEELKKLQHAGQYLATLNDGNLADLVTMTNEVKNFITEANHLIDAALSHEATTDAEVQAAINHYEYRVNKRQDDITLYRNSHNQELIMAADTLERALTRDKIILTALQQYYKPADAEVQAAIAYYVKEVESTMNYEKFNGLTPRWKAILRHNQTAIRALQQYRTEQCEWCKPIEGTDFIKLDKVRYSICDIEGNDHEAEFHCCPNCGRHIS